MVTPACDLSRSKTETLTYLPIVPIRRYFMTRAVLPLLKGKILGQIQTGGFDPKLEWGGREFFPPAREAVQQAINALNDHVSSKQLGQKEINAIGRAVAGLTLILGMNSDSIANDSDLHLSSLFGTEWEKLLQRLITNSFSSNLHFLPADGQVVEYSAVPAHSVIMFRYPITVPIEVLNLAQEASERSWKELVYQNINEFPTLKYFDGALPIKILNLKSTFLADMLCRFIGVYNQVGSPDFTEDTIVKMIAEART